MTDRSGDGDRASREAADWMARLNKRAVDGRTIEDFYAWRRQPANCEAYSRLEALWGKAEPLGADRDVAMALGQALRPRRWTERLREALRPPLSRPAIASALTIMLITVAALFWTIRPIAYETQVGEQRFVTLEDGSRVRLNTDSRLELRFSKRERRIDLDRGQAFFEVAHDRSRPFVVRIGDAQVTALGTRFDVRRDNGDVRVVLAQGAVAVTDGPESGLQRLTSGQAITLAPGRAARPEPIDVDAATAWTTGRTIFTGAPLADAVAEVNRYTRRGILLDAPAFANARVNGAFETGDVAAFVAAVTTLFPLQAVAEPDGRTRLIPAG